jgi:hypothetical protein
LKRLYPLNQGTVPLTTNKKARSIDIHGVFIKKRKLNQKLAETKITGDIC